LTKKLGNSGADKGPVHLDEWVAANQPRLHPTRRKVLAAAARLTQGGGAAPSTELRAEVGLSQQLLNRHLHGLEEEGLVALERQGPGRPLEVTATAAGLRAAGLRGPRPPAQAQARPEPEPSPEPRPRPEPAPAPEPRAQAEPAEPPADRPAPPDRVARFLDSLYDAVEPYSRGLSREEFWSLARPVLGRRPLAPALHAALAAHLGHMDRSHFQEMLAEVARTVARPAAGRGRAKQPAKARPAGPPELDPAGQALERQLAESCHPDYRGLAWHRRTRRLSDEWDVCRRRRLGVFNTAFDSFSPRWEHPAWWEFNEARRQADGRGARYGDWVAAQFDRLAPGGEREVPASELHGDEALEAYRRRHPAVPGANGKLGPPPYDLHSFRLDNPEHAAYAQRLIQEIAGLARRVLGPDYEEGPARFLAEAVRAGTLPRPALELAPRWRESTLKELERQASEGSSHAQPPVII
jgi:DNA-binding transcriptional ArsR family regulator